ncbi:hypothetical protein KNE206_40290 [Kitasatospora sp. NE20-6]|uniref:hypothetical protein n=1 Tax=Kitasatospora sp. NE20-6 TaxID=2859066 RepID=UPI0034DCBF50
MRTTVRLALALTAAAVLAATAPTAATAAGSAAPTAATAAGSAAPTAAELAQQPHSIPVLAVTDLGALTTLGKLGYDFSGLLGQP